MSSDCSDSHLGRLWAQDHFHRLSHSRLSSPHSDSFGPEYRDSHDLPVPSRLYGLSHLQCELSSLLRQRLRELTSLCWRDTSRAAAASRICGQIQTNLSASSPSTSGPSRLKPSCWVPSGARTLHATWAGGKSFSDLQSAENLQ